MSSNAPPSVKSPPSTCAVIVLVCEDAIASRVKLADLEDNMDLSRLAEIKEEDRARLEKYQSAHDKITNSTRTCSGCGNPPIYCDCHEYV